VVILAFKAAQCESSSPLPVGDDPVGMMSKSRFEKLNSGIAGGVITAGGRV
jgi:hypothetical protein